MVPQALLLVEALTGDLGSVRESWCSPKELSLAGLPSEEAAPGVLEEATVVVALDFAMDPGPGYGAEALLLSPCFESEYRLLRLALEAGALCHSEGHTG